MASDQYLHCLSNQQVVEWTVQLFLIIPFRQADQQQTVILAEEPTNKGCASVDSEGPDQPASADQGIHCLQTESLDTTICMNGEQRPQWYIARAQDDLNLHILRMYEGTFSLNTAHMVW